jgi:hypothetical protein
MSASCDESLPRRSHSLAKKGGKSRKNWAKRKALKGPKPIFLFRLAKRYFA